LSGGESRRLPILRGIITKVKKILCLLTSNNRLEGFLSI
jgi:hypothetical protein